MEKNERERVFHKDDFDKKRRNHRNYQEDYQHRGSKRGYGSKIIETKLFTSKEELVEYVNIKGQGSVTIEIYKIEDGLYKLVIKE